jgi:hypothetical protein
MIVSSGQAHADRIFLWQPNAAAQPLLEAGATEERRL